ncbi:mycothiol synthase [Mycetocola sp. CAN_C7]|uniref:mycothiol synthase n=1 Tax=Mycetocola sp. CAN_C7 TaxID=2787724 RepID=UPI0018CBE2B7
MPRPTLRVRDIGDAGTRAAFDQLIRRAVAGDGASPFNDQALVDLETGARSLIVVLAPPESPSAVEIVVGAAVLGQGELEFVIDPEWRGAGFGSSMLRELLGNVPPSLLAWAHGDHPAARALAARTGFERVRVLLQLRMPLGNAPSAAPVDTITTFRPDVDDDEWIELNARVFAHHPEQGRLTVDDLRARRAEPWFDAGDFLLAREDSGRMIGYNWLKIDDSHGEIYVIGVSEPGRGLGRSLMLAGLQRMRERGVTTASLYVEQDNEAAVNLYRSLGFTDHTVDVQYRRTPAA